MEGRGNPGGVYAMSKDERERRCVVCGKDVFAERGTAAWWVDFETHTIKWLCRLCAGDHRLDYVTGEVSPREVQRRLLP